MGAVFVALKAAVAIGAFGSPLVVTTAVAAGLERGRLSLAVLAIAAVAAGAVGASRHHRRTRYPREGAPRLHDVVSREIERSRRHQHPLALVRIPLGVNRETGAAGRYLAATARRHLRTIDEAVVEGAALYLVLSETDEECARRALRRLAAAEPALFRGAVRVAAFPDDGVTAAALVAKLAGDRTIVDPSHLPRLRPTTVNRESGEVEATKSYVAVR